jgi:HK97 gp10 family phage protein
MAGQVRKADFDLDATAFLAALKTATEALKIEARKEIDALAITVQNRAREYAPVKYGQLRNSIMADIPGKVGANGSYTVEVGTSVDYARPVEFGSRPHEIRAKNGGALSFDANFGEVGPFGAEMNIVVVKKVNHPGTDPQPFMRPALLEAIQEWSRKHPR